MRCAQQPTMVGFDSTIAFAGRLSQTDRVRNIHVTAAVTDNSSLLQRMGDDGNRVALHADQLCQGLLRQRSKANSRMNSKRLRAA